MPPPAPTPPTERRQAVLDAWQALRRERRRSEAQGVLAGGALAEAEARYDALAREYAAARIVAGLGPDPAVVAPELFRDVLYAIASPGRFARRIPKTPPAHLARETMTAMLSSAPDIGPLLRAARRRNSAETAFDPHAPRRRLLREWAERAAGDPCIEHWTTDAADHAREFTQAVRDADHLLGVLKAKYERVAGGPDRLDLRRGEDGEPELVGASAWHAVARTCPDDAREVYAAVAAAELAVRHIQTAAETINRELARFFAELVPRYFGLLARLPRGRRRKLTGGVRLSPRLAATLVEAARSTDFTADPTLRIGVPRKSLPERFRPLTSLAEYRRVRDAMAGRKVRDQSTVVARWTMATESIEGT